VSRIDELHVALDALHSRIRLACESAHRSPAEITLVAVTKRFPPADVRLLAELGVRDVGESRDQEARDKHLACADLGLVWHFVGQLQRNKARSVASYADVVHSVDRLDIVEALSRQASAAGRTMTALVQVSLDDRPGRGGAPPSAVDGLAAAIEEQPRLRLGGVMAVAPLGAPPAPAFARLQRVHAELRLRHPEAMIISAGMSSDLEAAIGHGATHLRIGTALLGHRVSLVG
jgi:pyridoxal phosphate enzyme (YggS family)